MLVRIAPIAFSVAAHVTVFGALYGTGVRPAAAAVVRDADEISVDVVPDVDHETANEPRPDDVAPAAPRLPARPAAALHTHAYPVPATHAAVPHDPTAEHAHAVSPAAGGSGAQVPAVSEPVVASQPPTFNIQLGQHTHTHTHAHATGPAHQPAAGETPSGAGGGEEIVPESSVSAKARLLASAVAAYPSSARSAELEADVAVEIIVGRDGRVEQARISRHAGNGFDEAALLAVRQYRFAPAERAGRPVRVRMPWTIQFRLR